MIFKKKSEKEHIWPGLFSLFFLLDIYIYLKLTNKQSVCACVGAYTHECSAPKGQKMALSYLELKLKPLKDFQWESQTQVLWKSASIFLIDSQGPDLCFPHNIIHKSSKMWQKPQSPCVKLGTFIGVSGHHLFQCVQDVICKVVGFLQEVPSQDDSGLSLLRETRFGQNSLKGWRCHSTFSKGWKKVFFFSPQNRSF